MIEWNWPGPMFIYHFTFFIFTIDFFYRKNFKSKEEYHPNLGNLTLPLFGLMVVLLTFLSCVKYYKYNHTLYDNFFSETNLQKSISLIDRVKKYCPRCDRPYMYMADKLLERYKINWDKKFLVLAKGELLRGQELNPYNPEYYNKIAQSYYQLENFNAAKEYYNKLLEFNSENSKTLIALGITST